MAPQGQRGLRQKMEVSRSGSVQAAISMMLRSFAPRAVPSARLAA